MIKSVAAVWLPVTDMERAVVVYGGTLGLPVTEHDADWSEIEVDGLRIGLNGSDSESRRAAMAGRSWPSGLTATSTPGRAPQGRGRRFSGEISEHPWGRIVPFKDPDGNDLQLFTPPR